MSIWSEYIGFLLAIIAALVAIRGDTWDKSKESFYKKITRTGYLALIIAIVGSIVTLVDSIDTHRNSEIAVQPIYTALARVAKKSDEFLALTNIAKNNHDQRAKIANEILDHPTFEMLGTPKSSCKSFIDSWTNWRLETNPRIRSDLEMLEVICKSKAPEDAEFFNQFSTLARSRVCEKTGSSIVCNYESIEDVETRITKYYLSTEQTKSSP